VKTRLTREARKDILVQWMLENNVPLTQQAYIALAYLGDKHSLDELEGEELADLPRGFEKWREK
jgi:hypothetical protein